jgi:hypothetical protein
MKKLSILLATLFIAISLFSQAPQKISYQAIVRNANDKLVQNSNIGIRISILQGSASGPVVYTETHNATTNANGLVSVVIGEGTTTGNLADINWATGVYFLKTETDPAGSTNYSITGVSQLLSVPYSLYSQVAGNGFSGDYNDLTNKPVTDGSETKIQAGVNTVITGTGTIASPYIVNSAPDGSETKVQAGKNIEVTGTGTTASPYVIKSTAGGYPGKATITSTQFWSVPASVSKIKVELWGAAGGGGGAGAYSYSYNLNSGGYGGSGGYAQQELDVMESQQFYVIIGEGGTAGTNATFSYPYYYYGDTDGGNGGDTWFGTGIKAAGGTGGKKGSYTYSTVNGTQGTSNIGTITGYSEDPVSVILNVFQGLPRSYINDRVLTSKPGKGGSISPYSSNFDPTAGEGGCAIITLFE